ncbi:MAG: hypothetical protein Tsb0034_10140 [Ekhidna sp.]
MSLYKELVHKLEKLFGRFDSEHKRFGDANNSMISRELGYSDSQFSRLINESATEGEYQRAILNVDRILTVNKLEAQLKKHASKGAFTNKSLLIVTLTGLVLLIAGLIFSLPQFIMQPNQAADISRAHTLEWTFESSFINPYVKLDDLPSDCNYPCYKYQGKWQLEKSYKLPFFRERNGFHYVATAVDMYARCMVEKSDAGDIIEGYEYQKHEIWYDMREWPIDSFITNGTTPSQFYQEIDFENEETFVKLATVHTFFRNEFSLTDSSIHRTGKVIGRDLELVPREVLSSSIADEKKLDGIAIEMSRIISNRLKDFSVPIRCLDAPLINREVTAIKDGDRMSFDCQLTTSGFSIDYNKTYVLIDQYIKNNCISQ